MGHFQATTSIASENSEMQIESNCTVGSNIKKFIYYNVSKGISFHLNLSRCRVNNPFRADFEKICILLNIRGSF